MHLKIMMKGKKKARKFDAQSGKVECNDSKSKKQKTKRSLSMS